MIEEWTPAIDAPEGIEVSNLGRVRRRGYVASGMRNGSLLTQARPDKILSPWVGRNGYLTVSIKTGEERPKFLVHRLVARAFVAGYFEGACVDHLDGNKLNNVPANLEWVTAAENTRRQWESGLVDLRGDLAPGAKITNLQAHAVAVLYDNKFPPSQIAGWFGISPACVYKIATGKRVTGRLSTRHPKRSTRPAA